MNEITYTILKIVVSVCAALLSAYAIPYLRRLAQDKKLDDIMTAVHTAVSAAEQTVKGDRKGAEKKQMALSYVSDWLTAHSIKITPAQLDGLIESAVYAMNKEN